MNWNEVFEYKEDGFLYWKESELKRSHFRNISPDRKAGCVGVSWHKAQKKWMAYISDAGKRITIGYYKVLDDAITARKDAERVYGYHENHGR